MDREEWIAAISDLYSTEPDYPWQRSPDSCVFRHKENRKWFALLMRVSGTALGFASPDPVEIINLKCDPCLSGSLRAKPGILPAYHMNKSSWITIPLNGTVPQQDLEALISMSYDLTAPHPLTKAPKRKEDFS